MMSVIVAPVHVTIRTRGRSASDVAEPVSAPELKIEPLSTLCRGDGPGWASHWTVTAAVEPTTL